MSARAVDESDPDLVVANRVSVVKEIEGLVQSDNKLISTVARHIKGSFDSFSVLLKSWLKILTAIFRQFKYF